MKVVLDTNVFVSGVFFGGLPYKILEAWRDGKIQLLLSPAILEEYRRVVRELSLQFSEIRVEGLMDFMIVHSEIIAPPSLAPVIQIDPSDDKFLECAVAGKATCIVTGDKHLLKLIKFREISMESLATTRLSSKGQVVIPEEIRDRLGLKAGTQFVVVGNRDVVILKAISAPSVKEFNDLIGQARQQARRAGLRKSDVEAAVARVWGLK